MKWNRIFTIVVDSLGVGALQDGILYGDINVDTLGHIASYSNGLTIPNLSSLGIANLHFLDQVNPVANPLGYYCKAAETSKGKDTITGHYELMGLVSEKPFITFTEQGFPKELILEMERQLGFQLIGNKAASGTEIIEELGEQHIREKKLIIYTSADSVLQIAAHEQYFGLEELYRCCEITRSITLDPKWRIGRVIARPFIGEPGAFHRTANRKDYALDPSGTTALDLLTHSGYQVIAIGKIADIFNRKGISEEIHSTSSIEGMKQTIAKMDQSFQGLCFTNLVDFDALWGHRRNPDGYRMELERFDILLGEFMKKMKSNDLLILCADHGNDPTYIGSDHTREYIPIIFYSPCMQGHGLLPIAKSFSIVGKTILENFDIKNQLYGSSYFSFLF